MRDCKSVGPVTFTRYWAIKIISFSVPARGLFLALQKFTLLLVLQEAAAQYPGNQLAYDTPFVTIDQKYEMREGKREYQPKAVHVLHVFFHVSFSHFSKFQVYLFV